VYVCGEVGEEKRFALAESNARLSDGFMLVCVISVPLDKISTGFQCVRVCSV
jgi:hypothetical protein